MGFLDNVGSGFGQDGGFTPFGGGSPGSGLGAGVTGESGVNPIPGFTLTGGLNPFADTELLFTDITGSSPQDFWKDISGASAAEDATQAQLQGIANAQGTLEEYLSPYSQSGEMALGQMNALSGAMGPQAQQAAINAIQNSPGFQAQLQQGENSILQNASATGGLRGGNTQAALGQFSPMMLQNEIQRNYSNLGGLANMGANAAGQLGGGIADLYTSAGDTKASGDLAAYQMQKEFGSDIFGGIMDIGGLILGDGGIGGFLGGLF